MCGIAGIIHWTKTPSCDHVAVMSAKLAHRGPDAGGIHVMGNAAFGHKRLSIIDISDNANQPMVDHDSRFMLTFNGEIYNFVELREQLEAKNHHFRTRSDTEVILEAWKEWGEEALQKFTGMYAFALWDNQEKILYIVRDRLGEKPLYFCPLDNNWENGFIFASEMQALVSCPGVMAQLDSSGLQQYLRFGHTFSDSCIYKNIQKLPPAHMLVLTCAQAPKLKKYWDISKSFLNKQESISVKSAKEELLSLLDNAVSRQLRSDVPVGIMLSGGMDSTAIASSVAAVSDASRQHIQSFCASFSDASYNEAEQSSKIATYLGFHQNIHAIDHNQYSFMETLHNAVAKMDEPLADNSFIPMLALSEYIRKDIKVCLAGDGGDELFLGYDTYVANVMHGYFHHLPDAIKHPIAALASSKIPTSFDKVSFDFKLKRFLRGSALSPTKAHSSWRAMMYDEDVTALLNIPGKYSYDTLFEEHLQPLYNEVSAAHLLDQCAYVDIKTWLVDDILVKTDRATMAYGLECRAPLLDHHLVEFAASLPISLKLCNGYQKKYILRNALKERIPASLIQKKKLGFNSPVSHWLLYLPKEDFISALHHYKADDYMDRMVLINWFDQHQRREQDRSYAIYTILVFLLWINR